MNDQEKIRTALRKVPGFNKVEFLNGGILIDGVLINGLHELEIKKKAPFGSTEVTISFRADVAGL